jgi:transcription initiation factor TFIIB
VEEIEKLREIERAEPEKLKERTRLRREKEKVDEFEKFTVECPECKSHTLVRDYERAELVCSDCGLVIDENFIDQGPEWRAFDHDQRMKRSRVGAPMTYTIHDKGLSTMIDWRNRDSYGKTISSKNRAQLYRLRKWQRRIRVSNATERNLAFALSELDRMASALGLSRNVRETAAVVYRKAVDKNLIRGRSIEGVAAAALYIASILCGDRRTQREVADVAGVTEVTIRNRYKELAEELDIEIIL